jgi:pSer/pThr/pTyr-binding forkhead associated (FHA) protein
MNAESLAQKIELCPIDPPQLMIETQEGVETLALSGRTIWTFGRSKKNTVRLNDPNASRIHAQLAIYPDNTFYFIDLKSRNGTFINDEPVTTPQRLNHGDRICIGDTTLVFEHFLESGLDQTPSDAHPTVLMLHASSAQALFWQELLVFQNVSVLKEMSVPEFKQQIDLIEHSETSSPKVLLIDVRAYEGDCYQFCRWVCQKYSQYQIFLTDSKRNIVSGLERQVAIKNGAVNQFPAMSRRDLVLNSAEVLRQVNEVLQVLETKLIEKEELLSILRTNKILKDWHASDIEPVQLPNKAMAYPSTSSKI